MEDKGWRMEDGGWRMEDAGCRMQDAGCRMQDAGCRSIPGYHSRFKNCLVFNQGRLNFKRTWGRVIKGCLVLSVHCIQLGFSIQYSVY